ncbi:MAG TPA: hypothetical protein VI277_07065 [Candidatus Limnocylindria bacterium]
MYYVMVLGLTVALPLVSTMIELAVGGSGASLLAVAGKWWVFWGIGGRLLVAGISQVLRPGFTVHNILGYDDEGATHVVQELGYANVAIGAAGILSLPFPVLAPGAAIVGGLFMALAGIRHVTKSGKEARELVATVTDLLVGAIALAYGLGSVLGWL